MPTDKMPKHVEMVRTKSKPKNGTDKMPTTKKSRQNANLYLLPNWVYSYGKTHWIAKPTGGSMAKPMVLYRAQSYGKTHWMGKAIGESMVKAMEPRL